MEETKKRQYWADYTKAFAIWLMVVCHFGLRPKGLVDFIYIFHMPVFFLVSGYFDKGEPFSMDILKKNFNRIIIPYFFFSICSFSICWISPYIHPEIYHYGTFLQTFIKAFIGMFLMEDAVRPYAFMPTGALWFLIALFNIKIIFSLVCLFWNKNKAFIILIIAIGVVTVYYHFPFFSLDSAFLSLPIYMVGFMIRKYRILEWPKSKTGMLILSAIFWIYLCVIGVKNGAINIDGCVTGKNIIMFYINGIIGSLACLYFFKATYFENKYLKKIGSGTLTILGTHGYINKLSTVIGVLLLGVAPSEIPIWYIILFSIVALFFGVWIESLLYKYCPKMIGKSRSPRE